MPQSIQGKTSRLPFDLHRNILDCLLRNKPPRQTINLTSVALVCREWRDWTRAIVFRNLDISTDICAVRTLTDLCRASSASARARELVSPTKREAQTLGSFIQYITITLAQPSGHGMITFSDLASLVHYTSNLEDLAVSIIQPDQVARDLNKMSGTESFRVPSLKVLRIRSYQDASKVLSPFIALCPTLHHLSLDVLVDSIENNYGQRTLPIKLVSFRSLGCWEPNDSVLSWFVLAPSNTSLRAIELHRSPSPKFLRQFAHMHGARIESLTLRSMEPAATRIWVDAISQFTALQHLCVWCLPSASFLNSVHTSELHHFEFRRPWTHSTKDEAQLADIIAFLDQCPVLRAVTYHAAKPIKSIEDMAQERGIALTFHENHYIDGYMDFVSPGIKNNIYVANP
jgi:hypothetical protein